MRKSGIDCVMHVRYQLLYDGRYLCVLLERNAVEEARMPWVRDICMGFTNLQAVRGALDAYLPFTLRTLRPVFSDNSPTTLTLTGPVPASES